MQSFLGGLILLIEDRIVKKKIETIENKDGKTETKVSSARKTKGRRSRRSSKKQQE